MKDTHSVKKMTIIGGYGSLGQWFATFFKNMDLEITLFGRNVEKLQDAAAKLEVHHSNDLKEAVANADIVWISTPIPSVPGLITSIGPHLKPEAWLIDVASLKTDAIEAYQKISLEASEPVHCLSLHPMFGSGAVNLHKKKIIFVNLGERNDPHEFFWDLFTSQGAICLQSEVTHHDFMMAQSLSIPHFINMANMWLLNDPKHREDLEILKQYSGTTSKLQNAISNAVLSENPSIYAPIQMENTYFLDRLEEFHEFLAIYIDILKSKDIALFSQIFQFLQKKAKTDTDFPKAYETFYKLYGSLEGE